jgi:TonB-linked SusC/RagA family outer membrane protein
MVGFNQEWGANLNVMATARQLVTPLITDLNATTGAQQTSGGKNHLALRGVFYRLNYSYKDKYLLEANGRYDGTSRFPTDSRFGFFPSVSVGWRVANESFMAGTRGWLDNLKLRASYGELGNQQLSSYYPYIASMGVGQSSYIMTGANRTPYVSPSGLVSDALTWETVVTKNLGVDITVLQQRLDASFDIYTRDTKSMLTRVSYPELLGTQAPQENAADLRTSGWELSVTWHDKIGEDIQYGINLALADNQSEVTKYNNPTGSLGEYYEGQKMGEIWGYVTEGIFQTDAEVAAHANQAQLGANWKAGDIAYKDLGGGPNGEPDGKITPGKNTLTDHGDLQIIGYSHPRYTYGINPDVSYKNWSLNIFFQGLFRDFLPRNDNWWAFYPYNAGHMEKYYITESWTPENPNAYFAAATIGTNTKKNIQPQSRYVQNGAYIRLKNLTLNYNLPQTWMQKIGLSNAQIYFAGMNLWEATKMHKPIDPEVEFNNNTGQERNDLTQEYYFQRTFSLGVKVTF